MKTSLNKEGKKQVEKIDERRRHYILAFVSYITSAVMFIYGINNIDAEKILLPLILLSFATLFLINILLFQRSRDLQRASAIAAALVGGFVVSLVYHGGLANTALYWVFPFPPILFGLLGARNALAYNVLLLLALSIMLNIPDLTIAQYHDIEISRFTASLLIVIIVCWINDHYRERSHQAMDKLQQSKEQQANTDALTQLANRRFVDTSLVPNLHQQPSLFIPLALIMCDIDHFKRLNDRFGHDVGDEVLKGVAQLFTQHLRQQDFACRIGGEEFLLILPHTSHADALNVAEKIRNQFCQQSLVAQDKSYQVTASFGVANCTDAYQFQDSLKQADQLLYQSKNRGRNLVSG
jgi:diguanylate cyclase (GGDEF)-like protein